MGKTNRLYYYFSEYKIKMQVVTEHLWKAMSSFIPAWPRIQAPLSPWKTEVEEDLAHNCEVLEVKRSNIYEAASQDRSGSL